MASREELQDLDKGHEVPAKGTTPDIWCPACFWISPRSCAVNPAVDMKTRGLITGLDLGGGHLVDLLTLRRNFVDLLIQSLLLNLLHGDVANSSVVTINDLGNLLKSRSSGLDIHEVDEGNLSENPDGVDEVESPGVSTKDLVIASLPGFESQRVEVVVQEESDLDRDV
ncbi:hypothetical protein HG531_009039 [Fusarium graminearum]|nr:hypothetical protein HG531_009039 [Fusarium graminearum]